MTFIVFTYKPGMAKNMHFFPIGNMYSKYNQRKNDVLSNGIKSRSYSQGREQHHQHVLRHRRSLRDLAMVGATALLKEIKERNRIRLLLGAKPWEVQYICYPPRDNL